MPLRTLFNAAEVEARISELGARLYRDYADSPLAIVCVTEGARRFVAALLAEFEKRGPLAPEVHEVRVRRTRGSTLGAVEVEAFDPERLEDRDVLVVDDVADEGRTLRAVLELVALAEVRSVRTAVLVNKLERRRERLSLDYVGFEVEQGWVVGFGMDLDGQHRELDEIVVVEEAGR